MQTKEQHEEAVAALAPITRHVTVTGGKTYKVQRLETRQIWPILRLGLPLIEGLVAVAGLKASSPAGEPPLGAGTTPGGQSPDAQPGALDALVGGEVARFLHLMAEHGERITEIVATSLDVTVGEIGRLEPQDTWFLLRAIFETNRDFFSTRVAPLLGLQPGAESVLAGAIGQAMASLTPGDGETPSNS